jgi:serine protease Do
MRCCVSRLVVVTASLMLSTSLCVAQSPGTSFFFTPGLETGGSYLGIAMVDVTADRASALKLDSERGVEVTKVQDGSPADKAGIKSGDVLVNYNGETILGAQQLVRFVRETPPGRHVKIQYSRDGKLQTATVLTSAPQEQGWELPARFPPFEGRFAMPPDIPTPLLIWRNSSIGIECEPVDSQFAEYFGVKRGVLVRSVSSGSPAERAGLKSGDVVTAVGDRTISNPRDLTSALRDQRDSGKSVQLSLMRDHKKINVSMVPVERGE